MMLRSAVAVLLWCTAGVAASAEVVLLTGELRAAEAERFFVPITRNWNLALKWLIDEGTAVEAGTPIARFDTGGVEDTLAQLEDQLRDKQQQRAIQESDGRLRQIELELERKRAEIEQRKARIDAAVPADALRGSEYRGRQLALARAERKLEDVLAKLASHAETLASNLNAADVELGQLRSQIARAERELQALELRAGRAGIVVHERHPWFGRKVRAGDQLQSTFPVASIPDLNTLEVEAWAGEVDLPRLAAGQRATLSLDAYPEREFGGRLVEVGRVGEDRRLWGRSSWFRARISLDRLDPELLRPGMSVRCQVEVAAPRAEAVARAR